MTDEERREAERREAERREAEALQREISRAESQINRTIYENTNLEKELDLSIRNVYRLIDQCGVLDKNVYEQMNWLSGIVSKAEITTKDVFDALNELTRAYFTFKNISSASKNMTQLTEEYHTKFSYYHELRRITLGYVVGLDANIVSSESMRKKVEKVYLQNSDYWLAYAISSVMLWASDEQEAAFRAVSKSLSINYFNTCLFLLLINLRFNRIDAARKWYINYLDRADLRHLGEEWQYLLQAYLFGAFGADEQFQQEIAARFQDMLKQVEVSTLDFGKRFSNKAIAFAQVYLHTTEQHYPMLGRYCLEYGEMKQLLSEAEKNIKIAKDYQALAETEIDEGRDLAQRIENVLYSLISNYDADEWKVVKKLKYNEAVVSAKGDVQAAQAKYNAMYADTKMKTSLGDLLLYWAFDEDANQTQLAVKRFSIALMKESIAKGFARFAENYRQNEREKYTIDIDGCKLTCDESNFEPAKASLEKYYDKNKWKDKWKDKFVFLYGLLLVAALITLGVMPFFFSKIALTLSVIVGLAGSFLLWRRLVDVGKILLEKKRKGVLKLKETLVEMGQWRCDYKEADAQNEELLHAIGKFVK